MAELSSPAAVIEIGTAAPWVRKWSSLPWVRGPFWDGFWILSALWLAPIVLLLAHGYSNPESSPLDLLYFGLTACFGSATDCRAPISRIARKRIDRSCANSRSGSSCCQCS